MYWSQSNGSRVIIILGNRKPLQKQEEDLQEHRLGTTNSIVPKAKAKYSREYKYK
jgi:hypothetical protein